MYKFSETVLPIYINGQCPIIKTCSDVTLNLSSKDSTTGTIFLIEVTVLLDFSLTVNAATLIFISGRGSAISSAKEGKSGFSYNLEKS